MNQSNTLPACLAWWDNVDTAKYLRFVDARQDVNKEDINTDSNE